MRKISLYAGLFALLHVTAAEAYIGPGLGAGTIAVVFGILSSIVLAFVGILWYPIKRLLRLMGIGRKPAATASTARQEAGNVNSGPPS